MSIRIHDKSVGDGFPVFFIAEIAGNFTNFDQAKKVINAAIRSGCDCIKFQTYSADTATTRKNYFDMENVGRVPQYELLKLCECSPELQHQVMDYCRSEKILAFSAPSHISDLELLEALENPVYKIGSDLACHIPLLHKVAQFNKPIILSTGMCTLEEVRLSVDTILNEGNDQLILMHCVSDYPAKYNEVNLRAITTLKETFGLPVGYSDHCIGPEISLAAIALGANIIERHFMTKGIKGGPDAVLSSDEQEMRYLIDTAKHIGSAFGDGIKRPSPSEYRNRLRNRVSICSLMDIPTGTIIMEDMVDIRRPGSGIQPVFFEQIIGRIARKNIPKDEAITWDMI